VTETIFRSNKFLLTLLKGSKSFWTDRTVVY